ncbi:glutathione synthase [Endozoicomonas sp. OPT23]|uniref:glutathione synthase n=1 Tax=Endozoicomonas sp. OPT23 TaxID=2072845 RepID=UPI00129ADD05|nr:glutathione synthase [Endozoicomonas sp. OPT23]MRI31640.1 glutathione synthase [Endozoicomonas sp. OPT23]
MTIKLGVVMDPIESISYTKDSTLAMLVAAQKKGWELFYMQQEDLYQSEGTAYGSMRPLEARYNPEDWYSMGERQERPLADLNVILMRKDPPFDMEFIYSTYLLEQAEQQGSLIVNKPQSIRDCNEKMFATLFPQCTPPVMVARSARLLQEFAETHGDVVLKPLDGMGGSSIFRTSASDQNFNVIVETLTNHGQQQAMIQKYIPEITDGDKRILLIDGEPVPYALARIPKDGEFRGNLAAGGTGAGRELSERDRWIASQVAPAVKEKGLLFVGLDVIGDYLTEINVTSPTCIRQLDDQFGISIGDMLMDKIEEKLS